MEVKEKKLTQIELLKEQGLYGTTSDPFWNRKKKVHECCGSTRSFYHKKGCKACTD